MTACDRTIALLYIILLLSPRAAPAAQDASNALYTIDARTPDGLRELFAPDGNRLPLVSAHRGGAGDGLPENCIATFEQTLRHGWAMLEIDLRYTKDHAIVLNHDPTLERTTNGAGRVEDYTLAELKELRLKDLHGNLTQHRMPTFDEVLQWARGKTILVVDKKLVPVKDVVGKIEEHHAESWAMVITYTAAEIRECHALNPDIMMEIMVGDRRRFDEFDATGVPWRNVIAFVGHNPPQDPNLCRDIHAKGASTMAGTSRNIDRRLLDGRVTDMETLRPDYLALLTMGVDIIETDIPRHLAPLLYRQQSPPPSKAKYFRRK